MIIVRLIGGVGNQLFQYAAGMSLAKFHGVDLKLDVTGFTNYHLHEYGLESFRISAGIASETDLAMYTKNSLFFEKFTLYQRIANMFGAKKNFFMEKSFCFDPNFYSFPNNSYLDGYWQSEKYFISIENIIRKEFVLKKSLSKDSSHYMTEINSANSVSIHIRRGDYVSNLETNKIHGLLSNDYYAHSVDYLKSIYKNLTFFIFSDDLDWCKKNLNLDGDIVYVNTIKNKSNFCDDFTLMSLCEHHIIANSTFSWWAAWLAPYPNKIVIAPKRWFHSGGRDTKDIMPANWITME